MGEVMMDIENFIRIARAACLTIAMTISITYRRRAAKSGERIDIAAEEGRRIAILRSMFALGCWGGMLLYLVYPAAISWAQVDLPLWLRWMGVALFAACVSLTYWVFSSLGNNVTHSVAIRLPHSLVR